MTNSPSAHDQRHEPDHGHPPLMRAVADGFRTFFFVTLRQRPSPEDVNTVVRKSMTATTVSSLNAMIFVLSTWANMGGPFLAIWLVATVGINTFMFRRSRAAIGRKVTRVSARAARRLILFSVLLGSPWGVLAMTYFVGGSQFERLMILIMCAGMTAGATFMLYRTTAACVAYYLTVIGPLDAACMIADPAGLWPVMVFSLIFGGYLSQVASSIGHNVREKDHSLAQLPETVGKLKKAQERISHLAFFDPVTELPNRKAFTERLDQVVRDASQSGRSFSVLMLDLDRFKNINDTLGHQFGDKLLAIVGRRLSEHLRPQDMLARLGGDEFAVIVSDFENRAVLHDMAARLIECLSEPASVDGRQIFPGTSIGLASYPEDGTCPEDLLVKADIALNRAKELGRGRFVAFERSLRAKVDEDDWLESELRKALEANQIQMLYQPKVDIATDRIVGAEALVRWSHPQQGTIRPDQFLPIAAERGLMPQMTRCILDQVCNDIKDWKRNDVPFGKIAINIHPLDLRSPVELFDNLKRIIGWGIGPESIVLEVTEGCFVGRGTDTAPFILDAISDLGFQLSLDDFGTGYASLSHLRKLPVSEIKVDRSFVTGICDSRHDRAIVAATIEIARGMDLRLVAEGVETERQREALRELGAEIGQGFLWSKPVPPDAFADLIMGPPPRYQMTA